MKTVTAAEMRSLDQAAIQEFGIPGEELMRRAGQAVATAARHMLADRGGRHVLLVAGPGNNGGDVFATATLLAEDDLHLEVWICGAREKIGGDARIHFDEMTAAGVVPREVSAGPFQPVHPPDVLIDGLLGTGSRGAPRGCMSGLVEWINRLAQRTQVLSIDIPSGIDADTGIAEGVAVRADRTVTLGLPKTGLIQPEALPYTGTIEVDSIGIPTELLEAVAGCSDAELIVRDELLFDRRPRTAHKGSYGHVLLIGGSPGMGGAIALSARAALRSGAGLVSVWTSGEMVTQVALDAGPEVMVHPLPLDDCPALDHRFTSVLAGPGMGRTERTRAVVSALLQSCGVPLVLDADALCVTTPEQIAAATCPVVLTPHPGEFEQLFGEGVTNRLAQARAAAERSGAITVLKGAGTVVAMPGERVAVNSTGNPGMAKGGSGDVLAGLLAGLLAYSRDPFASAKRAVFLHGLAGDRAAATKTQPAMTAGDIVHHLPEAFRTLV